MTGFADWACSVLRTGSPVPPSRLTGGPIQPTPRPTRVPAHVAFLALLLLVLPLGCKGLDWPFGRAPDADTDTDVDTDTDTDVDSDSDADTDTDVDTDTDTDVDSDSDADTDTDVDTDVDTDSDADTGTDSDTDDPELLLDGFCSPDGWCWQNPVPFGHSLHDVWTHSPEHAWIVGDQGTILQLRDGRWERMSSATEQDLYGIWAYDPQHVWAVGDGGTVLFSDGQGFTPQEQTLDVSLLADVWGADPEHVWVVSGHDEGAILFFDGEEWTSPSVHCSAPLRRVHGTDAQHVWVVGDVGAGSASKIHFFDGDEWTEQLSFGVADLSGVWAAATDSVWSVGRAVGAGYASYFDGVSWSAFTVGNEDGIELYGVWTAERGRAWAVGESGYPHSRLGSGRLYRLDAAQQEWQLDRQMDRPLNAVSGSDPDHAWTVGEQGTIGAYDGERWSSISRNRASRTMYDVWGTGPDRIWAVGSDGLLQFDGVRWTAVAAATGLWMQDIFGLGDSAAWATQGLVWDGSGWHVAEDGFGVCTAIWVSPTGRRWCMGDGVHSWNGSEWIAHDISTWYQLLGMWGADDEHLWITTDGGAIIRWDGERWIGGGLDNHLAVHGIWGLDARHVWVVGHGGIAKRWNGETWESHNADTPWTLYAVHVREDQQAWAVGEHGTIMHWDGENWIQQESGTRNDLFGVWAAPGGGVWAVGEGGTILALQ